LIALLMNPDHWEFAAISPLICQVIRPSMQPLANLCLSAFICGSNSLSRVKSKEPGEVTSFEVFPSIGSPVSVKFASIRVHSRWVFSK
jgi:hypothetical protein